MKTANYQNQFWIVRRCLATGLGLLYFNAFMIFTLQGLGLFGEKGLLPFREYIPVIEDYFGGLLKALWQQPTIFLFSTSDSFLIFVGFAGLILSLPLIFGFANFPILFALWGLHLSVIHAGQIFYSFGWETQLLELTFLSFFLFPLFNWRLDNKRSPPKKIAIYFMRWMMFRLMLGAGLIKIRGDECWRDLTCTYYHYETQPNPHFLSPLFHFMSENFHKFEVLFNHFVELIVPFFIFAPRRLRIAAALIFTVFQLTLIASGNLAWLNWITLVMVIPLLDDQFFISLGRKLKVGKKWFAQYTSILPNPWDKKTHWTMAAFCLTGIVLSYEPALNLISPEQRMNSSFNQFHLINAYGAFGSVSRERFEIIISGSQDSKTWKEYEFKCKPGDVHRTPCWVTPYHHRLDWQIWFSAMRPQLSEAWLTRLAQRLLENESTVLNLMAKNPFADSAPKFIKMDLYRYRWNIAGDSWWIREYVKNYMPPAQLRQ